MPQPPSDLRYAGFWIRAAAALLDGALAVLFVSMLLLLSFNPCEGADKKEFEELRAKAIAGSGGPVLNMKGEVVAVAVAKLDAVQVFKWTGDLPDNVCYAVKVGYLRPLLESAKNLDFARRVEPAKSGTNLKGVAARVQPSVVMVIAE